MSDENSVGFDDEKISKDDVLSYESPYKDMTTTYFKDQLTMLCNLANIQAVTVSGFTEDRGHAWNLVKLDGEFYNCDITNDAGSNEDEIQGLDKKTVK